MLKLSGETLKAYELQKSQDFYANAIEFIRENVPDTSKITDETLKAHILKCKNFMFERNLLSERAILLWSILSFVNGDEIFQQKQVSAVLEDVNGSESRRLDAIAKLFEN